MAIDPRTLEGIRNPMAGLSNVGQMYSQGRQLKQQKDQMAMQKKAQQVAMADLGSKITGAYAKSSLEWKEANPDATDEDFANFQLKEWESLDPAHREFVPKRSQSLSELKNGLNQSINIQNALHPQQAKEPKSSFDLVTLVDPDNKDNELSFHKDSKDTVKEYLDKGWTVRGGGQTINVGGKGATKYEEERLKQQAAAIGEATKTAESAFKKIQALQRFKKSSKEGYEGSLQPIISGVRSIAASFGYSSEKLKDVNLMQQAIGEIQTHFFEQFGARGLTDKDMEIIQRSLPRVETDKASRDEIADVLIRVNSRTIDRWEGAMKEEKRIWPELADKIRQPSWHTHYKEMNENRATFEEADEILRELNE